MPNVNRFACEFEFKFAADAPDGTFSGYGAVFDNEDAGGDVILKGAFKKTLKEAKRTGAWPAMLLQHGSRAYFSSSAADDLPIGVWTAIAEDEKGLYCEGKIALETQRGKEVYSLLKMDPRPAINGLSIGYRARKYTYGTKPGEPPRTLEELDLYEISLVTMAMNRLAMVDAVKSANDIKTIRQFEAFLRDEGGFSHAAAKNIAARGFKPSEPRDEDGAVNDLVDALKGLNRSFPQPSS